MRDAIRGSVAEGNARFLDASQLALDLLGDTIASNLFMVGYAYQLGLIPLLANSIERAIELNGVAIEFNKKAFNLGRWAAHDFDIVKAQAATPKAADSFPQTLDEVIVHRMDLLTKYQDPAYAKRYQTTLEQVRTNIAKAGIEDERLALSIASNLAKLMAYKDEYEVARLYSDGKFERKLHAQFEGDFKVTYHMAPPFLAKRDPATGHLKKRAYGAGMKRAFQWLAKLKGLRGTPFDLFGRTDERRMEVRLIADYQRVVAELLQGLRAGNYDIAVLIADLPGQIRGFGHVKKKAIEDAKAKEAELLKQFHCLPVQYQAAG
jgi:indolepyruvate ferredoxin oxidoreductase